MIVPVVPDTLIVNVSTFDGQHVIDADSVWLHNDVIVEVGRALGPPAGSRVVDGRGGTLLPGLIDSHVHAEAVNLQQALAFGVTTELDMANRPPIVEQLRALADRRADVADVRSAGLAASQPGPSFPIMQRMGLSIVAWPDDAAAFVAQRMSEGSDYIKLILDAGGGPCLLSRDAIRSVVEAAHASHKTILAHAESAATARLFIEAGGDALAHVLNDLVVDAEFINRLVQNKVFVIPTLRVSALSSSGGGELRQSLLARPRLGPYLDPQTRRVLSQGSGINPRIDFAGAVRTTRALHEAGIPILAGTDSTAGIPAQPNPMSNLAGHGLSLHHELELLVRAGLSPAEALAAATSVPARCFGLSDRGRIAPGFRADLLLVDGDPTLDIAAVHEIAAIWRSGVRFDREAYREGFETDATSKITAVPDAGQSRIS